MEELNINKILNRDDKASYIKEVLHASEIINGILSLIMYINIYD